MAGVAHDFESQAGIAAGNALRYIEESGEDRSWLTRASSSTVTFSAAVRRARRVVGITLAHRIAVGKVGAAHAQ